MKETRTCELMSLYESKCREIAVRDAEVVHLEGRLAEQESVLRDTRTQAETLRAHHATVSRLHDEMQATLRHRDEETAALRAHTHTLEHTLDNLRSDFSKQVATLDETQRKLAESQKEKREVGNALERMQREGNALRDKVAMLEAQLCTAEQQSRVASNDLRKQKDLSKGEGSLSTSRTLPRILTHTLTRSHVHL